MIASVENFEQILKDLSEETTLAIDTETNGLNCYNGDRLFSVIVSGTNTYYFNFKPYDGLDEKFVLDKKIHLIKLGELFAKPRTYFLHNAKFDLHMLYADGVQVGGKIHDTEMVARLLFNQYFDYSLSECAKRIGLEKSDAVDKYIAANKLFTEEFTPEGKKVKRPHFDKVPFDIISAYGLQDGRVTFALGMHQLAELHKQNLGIAQGRKPLLHVYKNDCALVPTVFHMERHGIKINREYVQQAYYYECDQKNRAQAEFEDIAAAPLVDSGKALAAAFTKVGAKYPTTEKGNPSFTADVLEGFDSPLAKVLLKYRGALKLANTYYANFLKLADDNDLIHANLRLAGTATGRLSCANPNLQNLAKEEDQNQAYTVRRCFVPRPDYCFVMIDYQAAEYRLLLDVAKQTDVCHAVLGGLDVHQATANMMNVTRSEAKCVSPSTFIFDGKNYRRIGSLSPNRVPDTFSKSLVKSILTPTGMKKINSFYCNGRAEGITVISRHGVLTCSKTHKFLLTNGSLKTADELEIGDLLAEVTQQQYECFETVRVRLNPFLHGKHNTDCPVFADVTKDMAYMLGLFMGDGCANISHVSIATGGHKDYETWQNVVKDAFNRLGIPAKINVNKVNSTGGLTGKIYFGSRHSARFLMQMGALNEDGTKCFRIPDYIFKSSKGVRLEYIAGLIDTDGTVSKNCGTVSVTTKSLELAEDLLMLLNSVGIFCSIEACWNKTYKKYYYRLRLAKRCAFILKNFLRHKEKRDKLKEAAFSYAKSPFPNAVILKVPQKEIELVDINIASDDHLYISNGLTTHNTLNFMLLYGGGVKKLATALNIPEGRAVQLRDAYFSAMPKVTKWSNGLKSYAEKNGSSTNWAGFVCRFPKEYNNSYTAPNHIIQGGCAQIIRFAMPLIHALLEGKKSRMLLSIHDEILLEMHKDELDLVAPIQKIMEDIYPFELLPQACEVSHSWLSWGDKSKGSPIESRNSFQDKSQS